MLILTCVDQHTNKIKDTRIWRLMQRAIFELILLFD